MPTKPPPRAKPKQAAVLSPPLPPAHTHARAHLYSHFFEALVALCLLAAADKAARRLIPQPRVPMDMGPRRATRCRGSRQGAGAADAGPSGLRCRCRCCVRRRLRCRPTLPRRLAASGTWPRSPRHVLDVVQDVGIPLRIQVQRGRNPPQPPAAIAALVLVVVVVVVLITAAAGLVAHPVVVLPLGAAVLQLLLHGTCRSGQVVLGGARVPRLDVRRAVGLRVEREEACC